MEIEDDQDDCTPLHLALIGQHNDVAKLLVQYGANVVSPDLFGLTLLHVAAMTNDVTMCLYLIEYGADVTATDNDGHTAADIAAVMKCSDIEKLLSEHTISQQSCTDINQRHLLWYQWMNEMNENFYCEQAGRTCKFTIITSQLWHEA